MLSPSKGRWRVLVTHRGKLSASDCNRCGGTCVGCVVLYVCVSLHVLCCPPPPSVFLVDHAWTFQPHLVAKQLRCIPGLASRIAGLMDLDGFPCLSGEEADR